MSLTSICLILLLASCSSSGSSSTPSVALGNSAAMSTMRVTAALAPSAAGPALAQSPVVCSSTQACLLAKAPANGDVLSVVVLDGAPDLGSIIVSDSLGKHLTRSTISPNCASLGHCVAVYDELVSGTPTNRITVSNYEYKIAVYDIAGAIYPGNYAANSSGGVPSVLAATIAGVKANDVQVCAYLQPVNSTGNVTLTFSNGSGAYDVAATEPSVSHATATATASSTCTASNLNADHSSAIAYADYSASQTLATPTPAPLPSVVAGPSIRQAPTCAMANNWTYSFGTAPQTGDRATFIAASYATVKPPMLQDSNGAAGSKITEQLNFTNNASNYGEISDGVIVGSPTATFKVTNPSAFLGCMFDATPASSATYASGTGTAATVALTFPKATAGDLIECEDYDKTGGTPKISTSAGTMTTGQLRDTGVWGYETVPSTGPLTITVANWNRSASALGCVDYSNAVAAGPTPTPTTTPTSAPTPTPAPTTLPAGSITYNATSSCIANVLYTNNVLPAGVGEFATNGLNRAYWGGVKTRTVGANAGTWGPGFYPSWGRHQYDTYFGDSSDGLGIDPFTVTNDTAVAGSPQALRIMAEPIPSNIANSLTVMANDQYVVTAATEPYLVPAEGGSLTVNVANPNGAQNKWKVGMGYAGGAVTFIGTLTSGGATPSGKGSGGSNPWTISNIHVYSGTPGTAITPGINDEGGLRSYNFPQYYSGALDTNINQQYGFFVSRVRLPNFLPALSPAFWTLETGGVANGPNGLTRNEDDIEEMFGNTEGNSLNAGQILWNTSTFWPKPTGVYGFPSGTPQSAYHDYGVLLTPNSTSFYLDGQLIAGHSGGPDWTQGSPDKEVMLMFQVGAPGSWLDASSQGPNNPWPQYYWTQWIRVYQPTKTAC
jgi:hypothetical protein